MLWPNAPRCLTALGVEDAVREGATPLTGTVISNAAGRRMSQLVLDPGADRPLGLVRSHLIDALAGALGPGVLRLGDEVTDLEGVDADLLVGADGVRSGVRRSIEPAVRPVYRGYTVWRALLPVDAAVFGGGHELVETWGVGMRFGVVPVGPGLTYLYAAAPAPEGEVIDDELPGLLERFGDWHAPIPDLLARLASDGQVLRHDIYDLPPGRTRLHDGRRVLVGDAAHAMEPNVGQGAGLALEDAVVLDRALATQPSVAAALETYATARGPRVAALARQSRQIGRLAQLRRPSVVGLRDLAMQFTPDRLGARATSGAIGWRPPS